MKEVNGVFCSSLSKLQGAWQIIFLLSDVPFGQISSITKKKRKKKIMQLPDQLVFGISVS